MLSEFDAGGTSHGPVLVAVDFTASSESALAWASKAASEFEAPLVVLHVVHDPPGDKGSYSPAAGRGDQLTRLEDTAASMMSEFLHRMRDRLPSSLDEVEHRLVPGLPTPRILEVAEQLGAQMIVVGSRGRSGLSTVLRGSQAERVARLSRIPVTIVKGAEPVPRAS